MSVALLLVIALIVLIVAGLVLFVVARVIASTSAGVFRLAFRRKPPAAAVLLFSMATTALLAVILPAAALESSQMSIYRGAIPSQFDLAESLYHDEQSHFREGCGIVVFRLSPATLQRIEAEGPRYLESARQGRDGTPSHHYEPWQASPAPGDARLFRGVDCAADHPPVLKQAMLAIRQRGAFFTTGREHDLVVLPALGVVIFSHNG